MAIAGVLGLLAIAPVHAFWQPSTATTWQINLSGNLSASYPSNITAVDGDLFGNANETWQSLKAQGHKTICYFSAGSYEDWRPDKNSFNKSDIGEPLDGWPGESWLNTRSEAVRQIMEARMDLALEKGCDAVDPDNVDAYDNGGGGFNLTQADAIDYVKFLASQAHARGMACGLKNAGAIVQDVLSEVEFEVNEQCVQYDECDDFKPFIDQGKPVFNIEYVKEDASQASINSKCSSGNRPVAFETDIKRMDLGEWVYYCPGDASVMDATATTSSRNAQPTLSASTVATSSAGYRLFGGRNLSIVVSGILAVLCW